MNVKRVLGENIKAYRKKQGLTQEQLAERLNISLPHLANIEIGKRFISSNLLEKLSEILDASPSMLFHTKDKPAAGRAILADKVASVVTKNTETMKEQIRDLLGE